MSDFFEPPPPTAEPEREKYRQPPWVGPPDNVLGAAVAVRVVLARTEKLAVAITGASAFPDGVLFTLAVRRRRSSSDDFYDPFDDPMWFRRRARRGTRDVPPEVLRFGVQFEDGRKATSLGGFPKPDQEPDAPVLMQRGGGGGDGRWDIDFWLYPLPPAGPLAFVCEWPSEGVSLTRVEIDASLIRDAASQAEELWEDEGRSAGGGWTSYGPVASHPGETG